MSHRLPIPIVGPGLLRSIPTGGTLFIRRTINGISIEHEVKVQAGWSLELMANEEIVGARCDDPACKGCRE
jgi:hypothetical protein